MAGDELSCQAQLSVDSSLTPALAVAPCYTGSDEDPEELRELRATPGLVGDTVRSQTFLEQQRVSTPATGWTATTGRATSSASWRTS